MKPYTGALPRDDAALRRRLELALVRAGNTHTLNDLAWMLREGQAQWWCNGDAAIITEVKDYPQIKVVNYWLVAGRLGACLDLQAPIDAWAAELGCLGAVACGLPKWEPVLRGYGWAPHGREFRKSFSGEVAP